MWEALSGLGSTLSGLIGADGFMSQATAMAQQQMAMSVQMGKLNLLKSAASNVEDAGRKS